MNPLIDRLAREAGFEPQRDEWLFAEMLEAFAKAVAKRSCDILSKHCVGDAHDELARRVILAVYAEFGIDGARQAEG